MYLWLPREPTIAGATLGSLYVDGVRFCSTLEDEIREVPDAPVAAWKVQDRTAIKAGRYRVRWTWSHRFQRMTPELVGVEAFSGIRLHAGVRHEHTSGCILVGFARANTSELLPGYAARQEIDRRVEAASERQEPIWIRIDNPRTSEPGLEAAGGALNV